jgi:hypothetical protein
MRNILLRLLREPPFRLVGKFVTRYTPCSLGTKVYWEATDRPPYAAGVLFAAGQAKRMRIPRISLIEFGVADGAGLLTMQSLARAASEDFNLSISVFGFDLGAGLPQPRDFRDHPDIWRAGDYQMNEPALRKRLFPETTLILGDVCETVPEFVQRQTCPVGFISIDLDLYSSTRSALRLFSTDGRRILPHTPVYLDDVLLPSSHRFAGELLALHEFNAESNSVKIDRWREVKSRTAFSDSPWLEAMYMAHDLAVAPTSRTRPASMS